MHVGGERRWRRAPRQPALLLADLGQGQPEPAELLRHRRKQILGLAQLGEIFEEESVLTVVTGSPLSTALQQIVGKYTAAWRMRHDRLPPPGSVSELTS